MSLQVVFGALAKWHKLLACVKSSPASWKLIRLSSIEFELAIWLVSAGAIHVLSGGRWSIESLIQQASIVIDDSKFVADHIFIGTVR